MQNLLCFNNRRRVQRCAPAQLLPITVNACIAFCLPLNDNVASYSIGTTLELELYVAAALLNFIIIGRSIC